MAKVVNTLGHRIYRDDEKIAPGKVYDGKVDKERGQLSATSDEGKAFISAHEAANADPDTSIPEELRDVGVTDPVLAATVEGKARGKALAASRIRDPHGDAEDVIAEAEEAAQAAEQSLGQPVGVVETDPETGEVLAGEQPEGDPEDPDPGHPLPGVGQGASGVITAGDNPGAIAGGAQAAQAASGVPNYGEAQFATANAENKADELVSQGKITPEQVSQAKATGKTGLTVADIDKLADEG